MGEIQSSCNSESNNQRKQLYKKWNILKRKSESKQREKESIDLDIVNPEIVSSVISWNFHHKLEEIKNNLHQFKLKFDQTQSPKPKLLKTKSKSLNDLMIRNNNNLCLEIDFLMNEIESIIYGVTHNFLDGKENERKLIDYWLNEINENDNISMIIFKINDMIKINQYLGYKSGDNIIIKIGKIINEYCIWYQKDYDKTFKIFHPDFCLNEFIVISNCINDSIINDFCQCILMDISRSIKCYFQEIPVWTGYVLSNDVDIDDIDIDNKYHFRSFYEKAKFAISESIKVCSFSENKSYRIRKWLSKKERLNKGRKISNIIYKYYYSKNKQNNDNIDIYETIKKIDIEIKEGADLNYYDKSGNNPFNYSLFIGENELIRYLLQFEFDVDHKNKNGQNALIMAMKYNISESICCLIAKRLKYPNIPDDDNIISMVHALNLGYFKVMNILSKKDCTEYRNWIISLCIQDHEIILVDIIKDNGIIFDTKLDEIGRSILHYAVLHESYKIIKIILKNNYINIDIIDNNGWSPLHYASAKGYIDIIKLLIKYNANILLKTDESYTPFNIARKFKKNDAALLLYKYETNQDLQISCSQTSKSISPIRLSLSCSSNILNLYDSDIQSDYECDDIQADNKCDNQCDNGWNKENEVSTTNPSSNSENNVLHFKQQIVSKIDENICTEYDDDNDDDDDEYDSYSKSDSTRTRIIHQSFSDQIEAALIAL